MIRELRTAALGYPFWLAMADPNLPTALFMVFERLGLKHVERPTEN